MDGTAIGPQRLGAQGLGPHQRSSGDRAIETLLCDPEVSGEVDLVITWRQAEDAVETGGASGAYEVWARRGMIRFERRHAEAGGFEYEVVEQLGENPIANQDPDALHTLAKECEAARADGHDADDPNRRFIEHAHQSYPFGYERIAQLFDSPHAPDLAISPKDCVDRAASR